MGTITTGVGLMSGIDTASLIESLLAIEARVKFPIQARLAQLATAKSALLDVNSRLLSLKTTASAFRLDRIFESVMVSSSNPDVLGVLATGNPRPGSYSMLVKQLSTSSQFLTRGFSSRDSAPLGLDGISFELGNGRLRGDIELSELNGGAGIQRGTFSITDRTGSEAEIDVSLATSLDEVINEINSASSISIVASVEGDHLLLRDHSGGTGSIVVQDVIGNSTANDLGIADSSDLATLTGSNINRIGWDTSLSSLNDGRGVLIRDGLTDFVLSLGGIDYEIDLGRIDAPITGLTLLSKLNDGDGITINDDPEEVDFEIRTSTGQVVQIDLGRILDEDGLVDQEEVETVQDLIDSVNGALADEFGAGQVTITINSEQNGFVLTDNLGGAAELEVRGAGPNGDATAADLGILGTATGGVLIGQVLRNEVQTPRAETIGDIADRVAEATGGLVEFTVSENGLGVGFDALGQTVEVREGAPGFTGDANDIPERTLADLGFTAGSSGVTIEGDRVLAGMGTVLIDGLRGGKGLGDADEITVTDHAGVTSTVTGLSQYETLADLLDAMNAQFAADGLGVSIALDDAGIGVVITDDSIGPNQLTLSGGVAIVFGMEGSTDEGTISSGNLEHKYVTQSTRLADLNYGKGIGQGSFRITDSTGATATIDIDGDEDSLYEVMKLINTRGLHIRAEINSNGDGLTLEDTASESGATAVSAMRIEDIYGTVATNLRIAGEADSVGAGIEGSYAISIDLETSDTMDDLIQKLDDENAPISASVLNTGSGTRPWYLSFTSMVSGTPGDLVIDTGGIDLGLDELVRAQDAKAFIGSTNPAEALLVSSMTNELDDVIEGLKIDLLQASNSPVTINIATDEESILDGVRAFTEAFNQVVAGITEYDSYDVDTETRGPLLGDPTVAQVRSLLYTTLQRNAQNVDGPFQYLSAVGIGIGADGKVEFDEDRFMTAWNSDPEGVEALFASYDAQTSTSEEIAPGITVERDETYYASLGFGDLFDQMLAGLTDSLDGTLTRADERFQTLIDSQFERIERIDERLEAKRERLQRQFLAMEMALAQLQGQQGALLTLGANLGMAGL